MKKCSRPPLTWPTKPWINLTSKETSLLTLRRNLIKFSIPLGIVWWEGVSGLMLLTKASTLFTFMLGSWLFCYLRVVNLIVLREKIEIKMGFFKKFIFFILF